MDYRSIIGQKSIVESLRTVVKRQDISNAYLFYGPAGCGKKTLAAIFAKAINCLEKDSEKKPCGKCSSCVKFENGNHPNVEWIKPDGASIKIKQIQQIVSDVSKKPYDLGYKTVIIENGEKMTPDAQNAFLKTLEEPPAFTVFIILAENPRTLLPTVVSRCQKFRLQPVNPEEIQAFLGKKYTGREDQIKLASVSSNGIIGKSVQMLEQPDYFKKRMQYGELISQLFKGKLNIGGEHEFYNNRTEAEWFVELILSFTRDGLIITEMGDLGSENIHNCDLIDIIENAAQRLTVEKLLDITDILRRTAYYLKQNVNIKGSMDAMLLNVLEVTHG